MLVELNQFIIKPNSSGSSFGIQIFKTDKDIEKFLKIIMTIFYYIKIIMIF